MENNITDNKENIMNSNASIKQTVTCKKCGKLHTIECYPIINFQSVNKEFIDKVFSLELFKVKCDCGAETIVQYDTVIIDMYKKYIIYLFMNGKDEDFYKNIQPALDQMFTKNEEYKKAYESLKHTRLVNSINDMLEKLLIFDYDLDDKVIEIVKFSLFNNEKFKNDNIALLYFDKLDNTNLIFTAISSDKNVVPKSIGIDIAYYNKILDETKLNDYKEIPFMKIDYNFVNDLATNYTVSSDFKEYTVNIRDDVKFTDGNKLTAKDVAFSYNKAKELGEGADLTSMKEAKAEGDNKVVFTLNKSDSTFINKLTNK